MVLDYNRYTVSAFSEEGWVMVDDAEAIDALKYDEKELLSKLEKNWGE